MIVSNLITGFVNLLSFLSLAVTTSSTNSFLGATFILAASVFLEAMSLQKESKQIKSYFAMGAALFLYLISIIGCVFSVVGLAEFIHVSFDLNDYAHVTITSQPSSIYFLTPIDINRWILCFGITISLIPFCLAVREVLIGVFRKFHYNLNHGLWGK